ncbi:MAG: hypothetical protein IJN54_07210 [Lachnospiraceae bacterium]|nr:hypothetical protein [Lachnospiraceae bacterium]
MKKKVLAALTAAMVMTMSSMTVFAASPTVGTTEAAVATQSVTTTVEATAAPADYAAETKASEGFSVEAVSATTVQSAAVAVQNALLNDIASIGTKLGNSSLVAAATDASKRVTASVLSVVEVNASSAVKDANGNYIVTLNIPSIAAGDAIVVLHYNGSAWEVIAPSSVSAGSVTFATASLSPISVVKLSVNGVTAAPKTGETAPYAAMIFVIGVAGTAICGKKCFA